MKIRLNKNTVSNMSKFLGIPPFPALSLPQNGRRSTSHSDKKREGSHFELSRRIKMKND